MNGIDVTPAVFAVAFEKLPKFLRATAKPSDGSLLEEAADAKREESRKYKSVAATALATDTFLIKVLVSFVAQSPWRHFHLCPEKETRIDARAEEACGPEGKAYFG